MTREHGRAAKFLARGKFRASTRTTATRERVEGRPGQVNSTRQLKEERGSIDARIVSLRPCGDESLSRFSLSLSLFLSRSSPFPCVFSLASSSSPRGIAEVAETMREAKRGMQAMLLRQHPHLLADDALGRIHHVADRRVSRYHRACRVNILQVCDDVAEHG